MVNVRVIFGALLFLFSFVYFGGVFTRSKTIISLTRVGHEMVDSQHGAMLFVGKLGR